MASDDNKEAVICEVFHESGEVTVALIIDDKVVEMGRDDNSMGKAFLKHFIEDEYLTEIEFSEFDLPKGWDHDDLLNLIHETTMLRDDGSARRSPAKPL